jgi:hypothetical protein
MIILMSIISLIKLSFALCLLMVFTGKCMTEFDLLANYHSDLESLLRKPRTRVPSPGFAEWLEGALMTFWLCPVLTLRLA